MAVWEHWAPISLLMKLVSSALVVVAAAKNQWSVVYGPASALVVTLGRLGWEVISAVEVVDDLVLTICFEKHSPAWVLGKVRESVHRWRWRRVEAVHSAALGKCRGNGPLWRPILGALNGKDSKNWGPKEKGALRSLVANRQWPQQRLHAAGMVSDSTCKLCRDMPNGSVPGTLLHRHVCPALRKFREEFLPEWLSEYIRTNINDLSPVAFLALTRGLVPTPALPSRSSACFDTFSWVQECRGDIPCQCTVFTDGSLLDNKLPTRCHALGWAFVVIDEDGSVLASARGVPPEYIDTIQGAELWAIKMALLHITFPKALYTDCESVRTGLYKGFAWAESAKRRYSRVWTSTINMIEELGKIVHWMPVHITESSVGEVRCSDLERVDQTKWWSNQIVDWLAKYAAEGIRVPVACRVNFLLAEKQLKELVIYLGRLTCQVNEFQTENGVVRDSDGLRPKGKRKSKRAAYKGDVRQQRPKPRCKVSTWKMPAYRGASMESKAPVRRCKSKQAEAKHLAMQDAAL